MKMKPEERFPETFADVTSAPVGFAYCDEFEDGIRFLILRGPGSLCAYVGVATSHPLAGWDYDDLPISAHGGLTYSGVGVHGDGETYWYGWDYNHLGDRGTYERLSSYERDEHGWTPAEVYADSWQARWDFKALIRLAEKIRRR